MRGSRAATYINPLDFRGGMAAKKRRKRYVKFSTTEYRVGQNVPTSAIYECSECEELTAFKKGESFTLCDNCKEVGQSWYRTNEFIHFVSKNLNTEFDRVETFGHWVSDKIAEFSGTLAFVLFHLLWFGLWIYAYTGGTVFGHAGFDPYPFGLLTMIVSLEAIILSTFILMSQNRQSQKSELRAELDYRTNLNTEKNVAEVLAILHELREQGKLLEKKTDEVLEDANIRFETPIEEPPAERPKRRRTKSQRIIRDAGIDVVKE
jgi:uncharacterized membrane protein